MASCLKQIPLNAPLPNLIHYWWKNQKGCCSDKLRWRSIRQIKKNHEVFNECHCRRQLHLLRCQRCERHVEEVLMEIWRRWDHRCWWQFHIFFWKMILGDFDKFFEEIKKKNSEAKLSHLNVYVEGFLPGLVCIM